MEEFSLLKKLFSELEPRFLSLPSGPGDDCAIFSSNQKILVSHDVLVEGVHFNFSWSSPKDVAWKALATNESDIASMGGSPIGYTLGLVVPEGYGNILVELYRGFNDYLLQRESLGFFQKILGGDISSGPSFSISISVMGECENPILRSGAKAGDLIVVSGDIGVAGIGLGILNGTYNKQLPDELKKLALSKHRRPHARTDLGKFLSVNELATSMIDVSDGFIQDVMHLSNASGLSAHIDPTLFKSIPFDKREELIALLNSGDDYELIFSISNTENFKIIEEKFPEVFIVGEMVDRSNDALFFLSQEKYLNFFQFSGGSSLATGYSHYF